MTLEELKSLGVQLENNISDEFYEHKHRLQQMRRNYEEIKTKFASDNRKFPNGYEFVDNDGHGWVIENMYFSEETGFQYIVTSLSNNGDSCYMESYIESLQVKKEDGKIELVKMLENMRDFDRTCYEQKLNKRREFDAKKSKYGKSIAKYSIGFVFEYFEDWVEIIEISVDDNFNVQYFVQLNSDEDGSLYVDEHWIEENVPMDIVQILELKNKKLIEELDRHELVCEKIERSCNMTIANLKVKQ